MPGRRRLRAADRPAARLAALRRALGPALARRGRLRRLRRLHPAPTRSRPYACKYRDYVIRALQRRQAVRPVHHRAARRRRTGPAAVPATSTPDAHREADRHRLPAHGPRRHRRRAAIEQTSPATRSIADTIKIVSTSLLGLTVGCAQCHDHRYDPIPQTDYYRLRAVFEPAYDSKNWRTPAAAAGLALHRRRPAEGRRRSRPRRAKIDDGARCRSRRSSSTRRFEKELAKLPRRCARPVAGCPRHRRGEAHARAEEAAEGAPERERHRRARSTCTTRRPPTS